MPCRRVGVIWRMVAPLRAFTEHVAHDRVFELGFPPTYAIPLML